MIAVVQVYFHFDLHKILHHKNLSPAITVEYRSKPLQTQCCCCSFCSYSSTPHNQSCPFSKLVSTQSMETIRRCYLIHSWLERRIDFIPFPRAILRRENASILAGMWNWHIFRADNLYARAHIDLDTLLFFTEL